MTENGVMTLSIGHHLDSTARAGVKFSAAEAADATFALAAYRCDRFQPAADESSAPVDEVASLFAAEMDFHFPALGGVDVAVAGAVAVLLFGVVQRKISPVERRFGAGLLNFVIDFGGTCCGVLHSAHADRTALRFRLCRRGQSLFDRGHSAGRH